jgi:hypothetical protein
VHADVVAGGGGLGRGRTVGQFVAEVLVLQDLAELLRTPVGHQELQAGLGAHAAVTVVAEDAGDAEPYFGGFLGADEGTEALAEHRVGGQRAAGPEVVADAEFGVLDAHEGEVVDLVHHVLAGVAGDGGLVLARQVGQQRVADEALGQLRDERGGVDDLVLGDAGHRGAEDDAGNVAAGLGGGQANTFQAGQISGMSSTRIQCSWMFWRSVRSAESRAKSTEIWPMTRSCSVVSAPPSIRTRSMKYLSSSSCGSSVAVLPPSIPGLRWVYRPHQRKRPCRSWPGMASKPSLE